MERWEQPESTLAKWHCAVRQMAMLNFTIQILAPARADTVDEVPKVADLGLVEVRDLRPRVVGDVREAEVVRRVRNPQ